MSDATIDFDAIRLEQSARCEGWRRSPLWLRLLGGLRQHYNDRGSYRMAWGELSLRLCGLALRLGCYETAHLNIGFIFGQVFVYLPFLDRAFHRREFNGECPRYGFAWFEGSLHLDWGRRGKIVNMPWQREHIRTEYLTAAGSWALRPSWDERETAAPHWSIDLPYHYMLDDGEVQTVTATVTRQRATHGLHWFSWRGPVSRFLREIGPKRVTESIDVQFSEEVGAARGSWKGGCVGCGYTMLPGETPRQTLMRMQRERRFR